MLHFPCKDFTIPALHIELLLNVTSLWQPVSFLQKGEPPLQTWAHCVLLSWSSLPPGAFKQGCLWVSLSSCTATFTSTNTIFLCNHLTTPRNDTLKNPEEQIKKRNTWGIRNVIRHPVISFPGASITAHSGGAFPPHLGSVLLNKFAQLEVYFPNTSSSSTGSSVHNTLSLSFSLIVSLALTLCSPPSSSCTHTHWNWSEFPYLSVSSSICDADLFMLKGQVNSFCELYLTTFQASSQVEGPHAW